ncbi:MAG: hypothetical protein P4M12_11660 [Gammaproteobacteria bacterium]|nr:hypothetical protein [Gammaproteobacteria bacterium]
MNKDSINNLIQELIKQFPEFINKFQLDEDDMLPYVIFGNFGIYI